VSDSTPIGPPGGPPPCRNLLVAVHDCMTSMGILLFNVTRISNGAIMACDSTSNCPGSRFILVCAIAGEKVTIGATGYQPKQVTITVAMLNAGSTIICLDALPPPPPRPPLCQMANRVFGAEAPITAMLNFATMAAFSHVDPETLGPLGDPELPTRVADVISGDPELFVEATAVAASVAMFVK
jgi:hypothetical protein